MRHDGDVVGIGVDVGAGARQSARIEKSLKLDVHSLQLEQLTNTPQRVQTDDFGHCELHRICTLDRHHEFKIWMRRSARPPLRERRIQILIRSTRAVQLSDLIK